MAANPAGAAADRARPNGGRRWIAGCPPGSTPAQPERSGEVGVDDADQLVRRHPLAAVVRRGRIDQMFADMILQHLGDEPFQRAAARRCLLQHLRTFAIGLDRPLDRVDLSAHPPQTVQQLFFSVVTWLIRFLFAVA